MKKSVKVTSFGKFLRKLRIEKGEILMTMANNLEVSASLLSAVENGNRSMPEKWPDILKNKYSLSEMQCEEMNDSIMQSVKEIKINLDNKSDEDRNLVLAFAREVSSLGKEDKVKILDLLDSKNKIK